MWKKTLWVVAVLYPVRVVFIIAANAGSDQPISKAIPSFFFFLVPLGVLIFELRDGKTLEIWGKILLTIAFSISFIWLGVGTAGYYSFNTPTPLNIIKGLPLLISLFAIFHFAFQRAFVKRAESPIGYIQAFRLDIERKTRRAKHISHTS